jgi:hypothetical protein
MQESRLDSHAPQPAHFSTQNQDITRRYDAAQTPFHRLLDSGALFIKMTRQLNARPKTLDPYRLKVQLESMA